MKYQDDDTAHTHAVSTRAKSVEEAVSALNSMLALDRAAIEALVEHRVVCNMALYDHPTAQVAVDTGYHTPRIGLLGVINGIFGCDENLVGFIVAVFDKRGKLVKFEARN